MRTRSSEDVYDVHTDHLDTPRLLTDNTGMAVWRAAYAAFGAAAISTDPDGSVVTPDPGIEFNIRFPGQYFDTETGLHDNRLRVYDPSVGRYLSAEPIGQAGSLNVYLYATANPLSWIDPDADTPLVTGLIFGGVGAVTGGLVAWVNNGSGTDIAYAAAKGFVVGGVVGLTMGFGGPAIANAVGGGVWGGIATGAVGGAVGNVTSQAIGLATGTCTTFNLSQLAVGTAIGGATGGIFLRPGTLPMQQVTSWAPKGVAPNLNPSRYVMTGAASVSNYLRTVAPAISRFLGRPPYPYANSITATVPGSSLAYPTTTGGNLAGLLGQRVIIW